MGDLEILHNDERKGKNRVTRGMRDQKQWVESLRIIDIPLNGRKYTWKRGTLRSKIDRVLCDPIWLAEFRTMQLKSVYNMSSYHIALVLRLNDVQNFGS